MRNSTVSCVSLTEQVLFIQLIAINCKVKLKVTEAVLTHRLLTLQAFATQEEMLNKILHKGIEKGALKSTKTSRVVVAVAHAFNSSTREAEAGGSL